MLIVVWFVAFDWIERIFGYGGLCMLVFAVAAVKLHPAWGAVGHGFVPHLDTEEPGSLRILRRRSVGRGDDALRGVLLFVRRSGGALGPEGSRPEQGQRDDRLRARRLSVVRVDDRRRRTLSRQGIEPEFLGTIALGAEVPLGQIGLLLGLVGILFAVSGAAIDTLFSGAYNLAQFLGWEWGRYRHPRGAPKFTVTWLVLLVLALGVVMTGVDPVQLTEYAVIFSAVALPLTYIPIFLVANDRT